jgi:hypothetical protein
MVSLGIAAAVLLAMASFSGSAGAQSIPGNIGPGPMTGFEPPAPPAPPAGPAPAAPVEVPAPPAAGQTGGQGGEGTGPSALPSAGTGTKPAGDVSAMVMLAAMGVVVASAGLSMRRLRRRS